MKRLYLLTLALIACLFWAPASPRPNQTVASL